jgi:phage shock protein E
MKFLPFILAVVSLGTFSALAADPKPAPSNVKNVSVTEAAKLIKEQPKTLVLDVRTPEEFSKGHIPGAKNVDFFDDNFGKKVGALDPQTPVLVHCAAGSRSVQSLEFLKDKKVVYHMKDGFKAWEAAGQPVEGASK